MARIFSAAGAGTPAAESAKSHDNGIAVTLSFSSLHTACSTECRANNSSRWRRLKPLRTSRTTRAMPLMRSSSCLAESGRPLRSGVRARFTPYLGQL